MRYKYSCQYCKLTDIRKLVYSENIQAFNFTKEEFKSLDVKKVKAKMKAIIFLIYHSYSMI